MFSGFVIYYCNKQLAILRTDSMPARAGVVEGYLYNFYI
jgi:hypothetical protein